MNGNLPPSTPKTSGIIKNTLFMNKNDELNTPSYTSNTGSRNNPPRNTGLSIDNLLNQPSSSSNTPSNTHGNISSNNPPSNTHDNISSNNPPSNTQGSIRNNPPRNPAMNLDNLLNQPSSSSSNPPSSSSSSNQPSSPSNIIILDNNGSNIEVQYTTDNISNDGR
jgi:hypothetical protein